MEREEIVRLVASAKVGDEYAFGKLYTQYITPIYRFVFFQVHHREDAEDLTQTVFLRAFQAIPEFEDRGLLFSTWLYTIARNLIIDHRKKKRDVIVDDPERLFDAIIDEKASASHGAEDAERAVLVERALRELSEDQREVIILHFMEEMSHPEVAQVTGKTEEAVRALKYRAMKTLRDAIDGERDVASEVQSDTEDRAAIEQ